ncbi:DUF7537 family lipoprotein [Halopiger aswanensis]|uniref:Uncharacterized protein n=1 Tax=Halopiger aswanensis TaxID=148449 RepID=A0A3R7GWJ6_9EURY|nr:hypothetical protein [Halopiger aswanensis]RKD95723.1 hypothetical protein ATJ93_2585 [Halopiger aswanensis]
MKRLALILIFIAVLATAAGCAGVLEEETGASGEVDGGGDETIDPETNGTDAADYPYETDDEGLAVGDLASRQAAIFDGESYVIETRETIESGDGAHEEVTTLTVDGDRTLQKTQRGFEPAPNETWLDSTTEETWIFAESSDERLVRRTSGSAERYRVVTDNWSYATDEQDVRDDLAAVLRVAGYERTAVEQADGETVVTYEGAEISRDLERMYPADEYDAFNATITVSDDGMERYAYEFDATTDGVTESIAVETTFADVGETDLERPAWVDDGYEKAPATSISIDEEAIAVALHSGDPLPENATVSLSMLEGTYYGGQLNESLEPGETLYLAVQDDGVVANVGTEPDAGEPIETEWVTISVRTEHGLVAYKDTYET